MLSQKKWFAGLFAFGLIGCTQTGDVTPEDWGNFAPDHVLQVDIQMDGADFEALRQQSRSFLSEFTGDCMAEPFGNPYTYFHASIDVDGQQLSDIGIRKKGFIGSQSEKKPGFRINLDEYVADSKLFGTDNMTFNNSVQDPSLVRQCLAYDLFRAGGVPAPRCNFAQVRVNDEELGIYVHVEPVKPQFIRHHFGDAEGSLYEGTLSDFQNTWYRTFEPKTETTDTLLQDIQAITDGLSRENTSVATLEKYFDMDALMTYLAMEQIVGHWDGYSGRNHNNFFIYQPSGSEKFTFMPWGVDGTFLVDTIEMAPMGNSIISHRVLQNPALREQLDNRIRDLFDAVWDEGALETELDRMIAMLDQHIDMKQRMDAIEQVEKYIDRRREGLLDALPGMPDELNTIGCIEEQGTLDAAFETTWGTLEDDVDLFQTGSLDMTVVWEQNTIPFEATGVTAGRGDQGEFAVALGGVINSAENQVLIPYVMFDPSLAKDGKELVFGESAEGSIFYSDNALNNMFVQAGFLGDGTLEFDAFGTQPDDVVSGTLSARIYAWGD